MCPACSHPARDGAKFCGSCRAPLAAPVCACGEPFESGLRFCTKCGDERPAHVHAAPTTLDELAHEPAAPLPSDAERDHATTIPAPVVVAASAAIHYSKASLRTIWRTVDVELEAWGMTGLDPEEIDHLTDVLHVVLEKRAQAVGPYADIIALVTTLILVFAPRLAPPYFRWRRARAAARGVRVVTPLGAPPAPRVV